MDTLLKKIFALVIGILLFSVTSMTSLVIPAAKARAAEPAAPAPSDQGMQRMTPPPQGGMQGMAPGQMGGMGQMAPGMGQMGGTGAMGTMGGMTVGGMGGAMCPFCSGGGMAGVGMMGVGIMGSAMDVPGLLNLTDEQRNKIDDMQDELRRPTWDTYGKIIDAQAKLRRLSQADPLDPKKISAVYGSIAKLQQQLVEMQAENQNRVLAVLTNEQRERLKRWQRGEPVGPMGGMGTMGPGMPGMSMGSGTPGTMGGMTGR